MEYNRKDNKSGTVRLPVYGQLSKVLFFMLLLIYLLTCAVVMMAARMGGNVTVLGNEVPITMFAGVLTSLANIILIFMVVFYKKLGFITALLILMVHFPVMIIGFVTHRSISSLPGLFNNIFTLVAVILIFQRNTRIEKYQKAEVEYLKGQQRISRRLFEQTATAFVNTIDAKDTYSRGHSLRVAEYSEMIARAMGKDEEECQRIYYAALLHDVGKIGIPISIINKMGKLTDDEYEIMKQHPVIGDSILSSISEYPYLSIGAHYHHERYDGRGYPGRLKGEDIPELARIISVADAYDAMTSNRSYRNIMPQQLVREEIVKGAGTQFDPEIAQVMEKLIDMDPDYQMREKETVSELDGQTTLRCTEFKSEVSDGIFITKKPTRIRFRTVMERDKAKAGRGAAIILFDSLDARIHDEERTIRDLYYYEYCDIWMDGGVDNTGARKIETEVTEAEPDASGDDLAEGCSIYEIYAVRYKDHALVKISDGKKLSSLTIALPDSTRYLYLGLTGEHCNISDVSIENEDNEISEDHIPRIAERISFIDSHAGDIPNVQIDGERTDASEGIPVGDMLRIEFHTRSLPTARLVWHCPFIVIFSAADGKVHGKNYKEYAVIRLDGELCESGGAAENKLTVNMQDEFPGWDGWKEKNKQGLNCVVHIVRKKNTITVSTVNLGIFIENTTTITGSADNVYVALTGDQCALTAIKGACHR